MNNALNENFFFAGSGLEVVGFGFAFVFSSSGFELINFDVKSLNVLLRLCLPGMGGWSLFLLKDNENDELERV